MKILITGGAGFIGSAVCDLLAGMGHTVLSIDNYLTGRKENLAPSESLQEKQVDIGDEQAVKECFAAFQPTVVLHAAASYSDPLNWKRDIAVNIVGMVNLIAASKENAVEKFIYLETALSYGLNPPVVPVTIGSPFFSGGYEGGSSYAVSKAAGELYLSISGLNYTVLRLANVYGPRNFTGPIPSFYKQLGDNQPCTVKNSRRDFIYVSDVVACIYKAMTIDTPSRYFNVSTGNDYAVKEIFELVKQEFPDSTSQVRYEDIDADDTKNILLDNSLTCKQLDWQPIVSLTEGIAETIRWYKNNKIEHTFTHLKMK